MYEIKGGIMDIKKQIDLFYRFTPIPVFMYKDNELVHSSPDIKDNYLPPTKYLDNLLKSNEKLTYIMSTSYSFYGCMKHEELSIIYGPISMIPIKNEVLSNMQKEYIISNKDDDNFYLYLSNIPCLSIQKFIDFLKLIYYTVTQEELEPTELMLNSAFSSQKIHETFIEQEIINFDENMLNNSFEFEQKILRIVERGDTVELNNFYDFAQNVVTGVFANDNLRQFKNGTIIILAQAARVAIRKGISTSFAFQLSDLYIQQLESLNNVNSIQKLTQIALFEYTNLIKQSAPLLSNDMSINKAIHYVQNNTNRHITAEDVSNYVGFSRTYFSSKFKKELGFDLSVFILRCKLEHSKGLLKYSDKSISEISCCFCFSSQSHYQTAFKKQFGITPDKFRKNIINTI